MFCTKCGKPLIENAVFCAYCGTRVILADQTLSNTSPTNNTKSDIRVMVCKACNSNNVIKTDSYYVCQACGTKYEVDPVSGQVDVSGSSVKIDQTKSAQNYLALAKNAYDSTDYEEAEKYCNKLLEINYKDYKAWEIKGFSVMHKAKLGDAIPKETVKCFIQALNYYPQEMVEDFKLRITKEIPSRAHKVIEYMTVRNVVEDPVADHTSEIRVQIVHYIERFDELEKELKISFQELKMSLPNTIDIAVCKLWELKISKILADDVPYPGSSELATITQRATRCLALQGLAAHVYINDLKGNDLNTILRRYQNMIIMATQIAGLRNQKRTESNWTTKDYYLDEYSRNIFIDKIIMYHNWIKKYDPSHRVPTKSDVKKTL